MCRCGTACVPVPPTPPSTTTTTTSLVTTHWHFDAGSSNVPRASAAPRRFGGGRVIAVSDATGAVLREHVYLGGLPIALIDYSTGVEVAYAVHTDHLGTPRVMTDAAGAEVWRIDARPFGETVAVTGTASNDNRFPGQVFDAESGLHYNYFRDYDPSLGRYLQSDPIGLRGGLNTYAYVGGNPVTYTDPYGEFAVALPLAYEAAIAAAPFVGDALAGIGLGYLAEKYFNENADAQDDAEDNPEQCPRPEGIPEDWIVEDADGEGGKIYINPKNPHDRVRVMPGDPNSSYPAQQRPYVKDHRKGQPVDANGNPVSSKSPEAHIPLKDFKFNR